MHSEYEAYLYTFRWVLLYSEMKCVVEDFHDVRQFKAMPKKWKAHQKIFMASYRVSSRFGRILKCNSLNGAQVRLKASLRFVAFDTVSVMLFHQAVTRCINVSQLLNFRFWLFLRWLCYSRISVCRTSEDRLNASYRKNRIFKFTFETTVLF